MGRPIPLTIPVVTLIPTFKGLPMAITGSPTPTESESPSVSGSSASRGASTCMRATSVEGSCPTTSASLRTPSENLTEMSSAPSTTCWLVTMCPASSTTNPDPPPGPASDVAATSTLTTPRPSRVYTSRTEEPSFETGLAPDDRGEGSISFMVTLSDLSSSPKTPMKRKSAVRRPPMIAETSAVSAVFRGFLDLLGSRCYGPGAELYYIPAVYLPPAILLHKIPSTLVVLYLPTKLGSGLARDGHLITRDLGVRSFYKHHAFHLVEGAMKGVPIREPFLPPTLGEKLGGCIIIPLRGSRIERLHRLLRSLGRKLTLRRDLLRWG